MTAKGFQPVRMLPRWVVRDGSAVIGFHLFRWAFWCWRPRAGRGGSSRWARNIPRPPPQFASACQRVDHGLITFFPLGLADDGHFESNRTMFSDRLAQSPSDRGAECAPRRSDLSRSRSQRLGTPTARP